jgi:hypothetical protein
MTSAMMPIPWQYLQDNLTSQAGIARRLGFTRTAVAIWTKSPDWPAPVLTFVAMTSSGETGYYWWPDIQDWCDRHGFVAGRGLPRTGRPRKEAS